MMWMSLQDLFQHNDQLVAALKKHKISVPNPRQVCVLLQM